MPAKDRPAAPGLAGNAGVHLPHGLSYPACGAIKDGFRPDGGYPSDHGHGHGFLPHGMGVILCAPSAVRHSAHACPERHLACARVLRSGDYPPPERASPTSQAACAPARHSRVTRHATDTLKRDGDRAAEELSAELIRLMRLARFPLGLAHVGFSVADIAGLTKACIEQKRVVDNAPMAVDEGAIASMYRGALRYDA